MKTKQMLLGWGVLIASLVLVYIESKVNAKLGLFTLTGLAIGYVMQRSLFGFAGTIRKMVVMGNGTLSKAVLFLLSISLIMEAAVQYNASIHGLVIPGMSSVKTISMLTLIGGFLFGIGMMFAAGCASGTLTNVGEGFLPAIISLLFFCFGSVLGVAHLDFAKPSFLGNGFKFYFPDHIGYAGAVLFFLTLYGLIYLWVRKFEAAKKAEHKFIEEKEEEWQKERVLEDETKFNVFSADTYHKFFAQKWSLYTGAALLSVLFIVMLVTTGKNWGVTTDFTYWGAWMLQPFGLDVSGIGFFQKEKVVKIMAGSFFDNAGSMRNLGIVLGAFIAMLLAGGFKFVAGLTPRRILIASIGGLLMGYGARFASGCNIGAFYSALSAMSLSGIVFAFALLAGGLVGLKILKKV